MERPSYKITKPVECGKCSRKYSHVDEFEEFLGRQTGFDWWNCSCGSTKVTSYPAADKIFKVKKKA